MVYGDAKVTVKATVRSLLQFGDDTDLQTIVFEKIKNGLNINFYE